MPTLSNFLRWTIFHTRRKDGSVLVSDVCKKCNMTREELLKNVKNDTKGRFQIIEEYIGEYRIEYIRACQGHGRHLTIDLGLLMKEVTNIHDLHSLIVHGTSKNLYNVISNEGLSPRDRQCIHFGQGLNPKSGMRKRCTMFIILNVEQSLRDNIPLYISYNGVVCCPTDIPPKYLVFILL